MREDDIGELEAVSRRARAEILQSIATAQGGHIGGPLSAVDILVALYFSILNIRPDDPGFPDRDRFILSKGHSSIALYTVLAMRGYFPVAELRTFDAIDSRLQGHPDMTKTPGIDMSSGSLGLGFSAALGMALGAQLAGRPFRTYVMLGDGECNEGIVWEAAHVAAKNGLDRFIGIVDVNGMQQQGWLDPASGVRMAPYEIATLSRRWSAFGWRVLEVDGHDHQAILSALRAAKDGDGRPTVILAETIKGKGISFMERQSVWHNKVPSSQELALALQELNA